jgi:hypothetical protein
MGVPANAAVEQRDATLVWLQEQSLLNHSLQPSEGHGQS